ncbi:hypothetical protein ACPUEJ_22805 [Vibrio tubiashii]|uniref:hypothetical protein n=1 Tax=Vibrio tubiashii TaxID=29498 RepID=UPI003CE57F82
MYNGSVDIDMYVSGSIPGFEVTATAFIFVMNFEDSYGNKYTVTSGQQPKDNTGGADDNGNSLPQKDNNSTIII